MHTCRSLSYCWHPVTWQSLRSSSSRTTDSETVRCAGCTSREGLDAHACVTVGMRVLHIYCYICQTSHYSNRRASYLRLYVLASVYCKGTIILQE